MSTNSREIADNCFSSKVLAKKTIEISDGYPYAGNYQKIILYKLFIDDWGEK
jgi:hypothetical protein